VRALVHPITLAALVVLVLNDHVLKACWPGVLTGKLSDIAGMILAPVVLAALVEKVTGRRAPWACAIAVAVVFALTKTWAPATRAYEVFFETLRAPMHFVLVHVFARPAFSERVVLVRDPTDLVALPFGAIAAAIVSAVSPPRAGSDARETSPRWRFERRSTRPG
jgi:hypothetical protein